MCSVLGISYCCTAQVIRCLDMPEVHSHRSMTEYVGSTDMCGLIAMGELEVRVMLAFCNALIRRCLSYELGWYNLGIDV